MNVELTPKKQTFEVAYMCIKVIQVEAESRREASALARDKFYADFDVSPLDFISKVGVPLIDCTHLNRFFD